MSSGAPELGGFERHRTSPRFFIQEKAEQEAKKDVCVHAYTCAYMCVYMYVHARTRLRQALPAIGCSWGA